MRDALIAGLRIVSEHEARGEYVLGHSEFPDMGQFESGLPRFSKSLSLTNATPKDYQSVFRDDRSPDKIPEWAPFYALARSNYGLKRYFDNTTSYRMDVKGAAEFSDKMLTFSIGYALEKLVDRYIQLTGKKEFDEAAFLPIYREWEIAVFAETLKFDILVPLLMVTCDFEAQDVADGLRIERMTKLFQLARSTEHRVRLSANESVVGAATHALAFRGWRVRNGSQWNRATILSSAENFREVTEKLDHFLAALRAVSGVQTGYAQLLIRPDGWCDGGFAYLPQVGIISLRAYPDHFEQHGWLRRPPTLDSASCSEAGKLYTALTTLSQKRLLIASRRLNLAMLRSTEEDSIIDVTIGLEALLVEDGGKGEITHKLATRLAALSKMRPFGRTNRLRSSDCAKSSTNSEAPSPRLAGHEQETGDQGDGCRATHRGRRARNPLASLRHSVPGRRAEVPRREHAGHGLIWR